MISESVHRYSVQSIHSQNEQLVDQTSRRNPTINQSIRNSQTTILSDAVLRIASGTATVSEAVGRQHRPPPFRPVDFCSSESATRCDWPSTWRRSRVAPACRTRWYFVSSSRVSSRTLGTSAPAADRRWSAGGFPSRSPIRRPPPPTRPWTPRRRSRRAWRWCVDRLRRGWPTANRRSRSRSPPSPGSTGDPSRRRRPSHRRRRTSDTGSSERSLQRRPHKSEALRDDFHLAFSAACQVKFAIINFTMSWLNFKPRI